MSRDMKESTMALTQIIEVDGADQEALRDHLARWDAEQSGQAPGYLGARLFSDEGHPGRHLIEVDFASAEQAEQNNARAATDAWAAELRGLAAGEPVYRNLRPVYATSG